jgi:uncharacterized small protein (DUF1192 family)
VPGLERVLAHLDARRTGKVVWYGGVPSGDSAPWTLPQHPRLETPGWVDHPTLLKAFSRATAALDWMAPNPERRLAFSFRHTDYLGCGLPILTQSDSPLADILGDAGWASDNIEATLDQVIDHPEEVRRRSKAARAMARSQFSVDAAVAPLLQWIESGARHGRLPTDLLDHAQLAAQAAHAEQAQLHAEETQRRSDAEVTRKRAEVVSMVSQTQALTTTIDRLSRAVDEVAGFKRDAITVLGNRSANDRLALDESLLEIARLRADLEKKSAEIAAANDLCQRLENDTEGLRKEIQQLRNKGFLRR